MSNGRQLVIDCVVVGPVQRGWSPARALSERGVEHVVLERGRVAESWRTKRWDSFRLKTPGWMNQLLRHLVHRVRRRLLLDRPHPAGGGRATKAPGRRRGDAGRLVLGAALADPPRLQHPVRLPDAATVADAVKARLDS